MNRHPAQADKDLRALLRANKQTLKGMMLPQALSLMSTYYQDVRDYDVIPAEGDGLVVYDDITNRGRGTRFEIGIVRLFCLPSDKASTEPQPALRLRLRLCYKFDMDVATGILPEDTWSYHCWSITGVADMLEKLTHETAYQVLRDKVPAEVNISLEQTTYLPSRKQPAADAQQNWWAVWDVDWENQLY
ncbi:hypothetical protein ACO0LD_28020 [Undibacterium sp. Ji83W]|uniref:hypothetical protein n=1 Tax=Undibacterium sp. Ji83W TaxID=3413043 RepID=UPI003BF0715A